MKRILLVPIITLLVALSGCEKVTHLESKEFLEMAHALGETHSAKWTTFLGVKESRAYLETGQIVTISGKTKVKLYWTEYERLPQYIQLKIRENIEPWTKSNPTKLN